MAEKHKKVRIYVLMNISASVMAGFLRDTFGVDAPFWFGGSFGLIAAIAVAVVLNNVRAIESG